MKSNQKRRVVSSLYLGTDPVEDTLGRKNKVYAIAMVLSHSRYKYIHWYDKPPTSRDFILFHEMAFNYYEGRPEEIVYDQDRLLIVSENFNLSGKSYRLENHKKIFSES